MGVGDSLEAAIVLETDIPAGSWRLVGDGIVFAPVDVRFDVIRRHLPASDQLMTTFNHHFDPQADKSFNAVAFEATNQGTMAAVQKGDLLILKFTTTAGGTNAVFVPNGDGEKTKGRIPYLEIPQ